MLQYCLCDFVWIYTNDKNTKYKTSTQAQEYCVTSLTDWTLVKERRQRLNTAAINWSANQFDAWREKKEK